LKSWDELPVQAKAYINMLSTILEVPVAIVSTGPGREDSIICKEIF
jgi:adenylosuccinate synthase